MKILFLANRTPYPPYRGDKLKIYNLARRLAKRHELYLLTFAQSEEDNAYRRELEKIFKEVHLVQLPKLKSAVNCLAAGWTNVPLQVLYFRSREMHTKLNELLGQHSFDAVHVQHLRMSPYLASNKSVPRILDMPDAFSLYWERRRKAIHNPFLKVFNRIEHKRLLDYEQIMNEYDLSLVCSQEDLEYLKEKHNISNIRLLPNGVDLDTFSAEHHDYSHNKTLLFTGNMDYAPNVDAVQYFVKEIFPVIQQRHADVKLIIAGQRPVKKVMELAASDVIVTGFVEDLAAMYNKASVVVAPLRFGAGTQNKVLEAMAMGVPVVCSEVGFKGLGIASGEGAIRENSAEGFAVAVNKLLDSESIRKTVGEKGMVVIKNNFGWDAIAEKLEGYFKEISEHS